MFWEKIFIDYGLNFKLRKIEKDATRGIRIGIRAALLSTKLSLKSVMNCIDSVKYDASSKYNHFLESL